jgi:hypothetical protein
MSDDPTLDELGKALEDAGAAHTADPSEENLAAHNRAAEAIVAYRASKRPQVSDDVAGLVADLAFGTPTIASEG